MDNSWQNKYSSTWQSSTMASMASSSQLPSQESRNQLEMNTGHFYPHVAQDPRSTACGRVREPMLLNSINSGSYKSDHAELGNSFLAILSGPPSLLQCDFQQLSNPKLCNTPSKLPINSSSVMIGAAGSGVPLTPSGPFSESLSNHNHRNGADLRPVVSSRAAVSTNCSGTSVLHNDLQPANFNLQRSDLTKAVVHHIFPGNDKVREFSSPSGEWHTALNPANSGKLHSTAIQASQKMPLRRNTNISSQSSTFMSGCPRVFCLDTSGELLLSNTGLLGVVCSCHCLHMSISKFCEHSGLFDVNPGDAVRMDSGETIAEWHKLYFQKFGIRVPEDQSGWDWPEWFSATAGLVKSSSSVRNMSTNSDLSHLVHSSGGLVRSGQTWDNAALPKNQVTTQNLVNDVLHNKQQRNGQDSFNLLLKGLTGTSQSNLKAVEDNQMIECPMSRCSTMSKLVSGGGPDNGCQSISAYIDSISKSGNSFISHPTLQNLRTLGKDSNVRRSNNSKEGGVVDRDAVSSNIELRLGQPNQQSQTFGSSFLSVIGPQLFDTIVDPEKSLSSEHLIHNNNFRVTEECNQYPHCAASTSNSSARKEQSQSNIMNYAFGINNAMDASKLEQFKGDAAKSSVISMLLSRLNTPFERNVHSNAINNLASVSEHFMPRTAHCESHIAKSNPSNFPWKCGDGLERHLSTRETGFLAHVDKGKGVGFVADGSYVATESDSGFHKRMDSSSFNGVVGGSNNPISSAVHDRNLYSGQLSGMPLATSDAINFFGHSGKVPCFGSSGHFDNAFLRSLSSPLGSGLIQPPQAISMGFSSATSAPMANLTPALPNKEGIGVSPYLVNENLRLLAARHMLELSKERPAIASLGMNHEHGRFSSSSDVKIQGIDPSSEERRHVPDLTSKQNAFEVAAMKSLQAGATQRMGGDSDKLAPAAGLNNWCNFLCSTQGISLHSKDIDMHGQFSHNLLPNEQPSLRLGRRESNITPSEHGKDRQRIPCTYFLGNCSCAVNTKCSGGDCDSKGEISPNAWKVQIGGVAGKASMFSASNFDKDHTAQKEKTLSLEQSVKVNGQTPKKMDFHAFQWKDVPSKGTGVCNVTCLDRPADGLDGRGNHEDQLADSAAKCLNRTAQEADTLKEQEMSNISSGCSTPAVTQASIEVNNMDSCTIDDGDTGYANDLVVDEGSGIDKCWSSDDALDSERSAEFLGSTCKSNSIQERSFKALGNRSSSSLVDELKLMDSFRWKTVRNQINPGLIGHDKINHPQNFERCSKTEKRKRAIKWKMLNASFPASGLSPVNYESPKRVGNAKWHFHSSNDRQMLLLSDQETSHPCGACSVRSNFKRRRSSLSTVKTLSRKRDLHRLYNHIEERVDYGADHADCQKIPDVLHGKRLRQDCPADDFKQLLMQDPNRGDSETTENFNSVGSIKASSGRKMNICNRKARPVVCGKYGIISNGTLAVDVSKPAKIVSLSRILKTARRCSLSEKGEPRLTSMRELKKMSLRGSTEGFYGSSNLKEKDSENHNVSLGNEVDPDTNMELTEKACCSGGKDHADELYMLETERDVGSVKIRSILDSYRSTGLKPKSEIRKRNLCELIVKGKKSSSSNFSLMKISKWSPPQKKVRSVGMFLKGADGSVRCSGELCNVNAKKSIKDHRCESFISNSDAFCCVCGSSNKDDVNCLVECSRCLIRVHQACYGVTKVPKGRWYCRPCRTSSKDIACVLCGYGGGAMTRALRSRNIVKSLLQAWNIETEYRPKNKIPPGEALKDKLSILNSSRSELEGDFFPVIRYVNIEPSSTAAWKMDLQNQSEMVKNSPGSPRNSEVLNTITAGVLDSTVKQWVHMVCGLWTPGTRCPNVDTMSAFDVSGASRPRVNVVCSICDRPGGSSIQCRVLNCSVQFHPWCAHQKGLLQSEVEGDDNESVGFYGRCVLHATYPQCESDGEPIDVETGCPEGKELTCSRTEGYKGRKRDGFRHNLYCQSNGNGGCLVPQEQLNAWLHINGQKSCTKGLPKKPISDIEYDCRKEYARYKQAKGWKHLVVYKSGIHALGLYTSRFIFRGAMVVEYVGEIVGLRVADKRESEYQSGKKLQYKSACYFFRIDKEHIIDATRKGGIARFVNHSCLPNCVAKVISVRNDKKVVFFAERDIYPGEEITYDYHFNHEDEGKKIPCFCNSKNCRRYLN
ncbi:hypothetical protein L1049_014020 [Liquidambar formosana]|uniref:Histone-lysine N-methyltransferase n=1 Tax=Liquidambar formosana TaxID=63359 RepID=A0AAP0RLE3_LIQFO